MEPPGLFRGRGNHPKQGMLKKRTMPEDIIVNCSKWVMCLALHCQLFYLIGHQFYLVNTWCDDVNMLDSWSVQWLKTRYWSRHLFMSVHYSFMTQRHYRKLFYVYCRDSKYPEPPPGHKWKEVRHDNTVSFTYLINWLNSSSLSWKLLLHVAFSVLT